MGKDKNGIGNRTQRTYMYNPWTWTKKGECWRAGGQGGGGIKGENIGKTVIA